MHVLKVHLKLLKQLFSPSAFADIQEIAVYRNTVLDASKYIISFNVQNFEMYAELKVRKCRWLSENKWLGSEF